MKIRIFSIFCFLFSSSLCLADIDIDQQNIGSEHITQPTKQRPFSFDTHLDVLANGKISNGRHKGDHVHYAEALVQAGVVFYYCPLFTEGARVALGYSPTYLKWHDNPYFEQDRFHIVTLTVAGFTKRMNDWFWRTQISVNFDAQEWSGKYTSYDLLLWGRYDYRSNIGLHFGFWAETGLHMDRVYPILGFDWQISKKLRLSIVYPVDVSILYSLTTHWKIGGACRFFNSRFRVNKNQYTPFPLVRYRNIGAEFTLNYDDGSMSGNIHVGSTLGGDYRVAKSGNKHARNYDINPSVYAGAEIDVKF